MKILAFMVVRNGADILGWTVAHLRSQGLGVHVMDNWSEDGTYELLPALDLAGFERWPAAPDAEFDYGGALRRVEILAARSGADWCYRVDADEIIRSPWPGLSLAEAIARVDAEGYNAIDHKAIVFRAIDDSYSGDPERQFGYHDSEDPACALRHVRAWKNVGPIKIVGGGHRIKFPGLRVYPRLFWLKHYPLRTQAQAERKIRERLARRSPAETQGGWHAHLDLYQPGQNFIRDPATLSRWVEPA
jgi:hypothetical protein